MVLECQGVDKLLRTVLNILSSLGLDKATHKAPPVLHSLSAGDLCTPAITFPSPEQKQLGRGKCMMALDLWLH